jgi:predicted CXXCH cytochrome family protein
MFCFRRLRLILFVALATSCLGGLGAGLIAASGEEKKPPKKLEMKIMAPHHESVVLSGHFDVIYRGCDSSLKVDSKPVDWGDDMASPVRVLRLHLTPGMHSVEIGEKKIEVCVALNELEHDGPSDWKIFRSHSMGNDEERCGDCHDTESHQDQIQVGKPLIPDACISCHTAGDTKETHQALIQPLKLCHTCHAMHGSPNPSLLKAPKAEILKKYAAPK